MERDPRGVSDSEHITQVFEIFAAESRLTITQEKVGKKSDEPASLPALLDTVGVIGVAVSMDALYAHISATQQLDWLTQGDIVSIRSLVKVRSERHLNGTT